MKTKLRILSLLIALVMCFSLLASCGPDEDNGKDKDDEKTEQTEDSGKGNDKDSDKDSGKDSDKDSDKEDNKKTDAKKDPHGAVAAAFAMLADKYGADLSDIADVMENASKGTAEYALGLDFQGVEAAIDLVADAKNASFSGTIKAGYDNVSTSADIWFNDDIVVKAPAFLGDQAYGFKLSTIKKDLDKSPLLEAMDYDSADELIDDLLESIESESDITLEDFTDLMEMMVGGQLTKDLEEKLSKELGAVLKGIDADVTTEKLDGTEAYKITFNITTEDVQDFMVAYADVFKDVYSDMFEYAGVDVDDMFEGMEDSFDDMDDMTVPFDFYLNKKTGELLLIAFEYEEEDDDYSSKGSLEIAFEDEEIVLTLNDESTSEYSESSEKMVLSFEKVNKSGNTGFVISFSDKVENKDLEDDEYSYDYEEEGKISFIRDKKGAFELTVEVDGDEVAAVTGTLKYDSKSFEIGIDSIAADGDEIEINVSFSVKVGGKVEKAPKYKNVITMSEDDWMELAETVQNSTIIEELGGLMEGLNSYDDYDDEYYDDYDDEYYDDEYYDDYDDEYYADEFYDDYEF